MGWTGSKAERDGQRRTLEASRRRERFGAQSGAPYQTSCDGASPEPVFCQLAVWSAGGWGLRVPSPRLGESLGQGPRNALLGRP
jgi:hypothetical protein